MTGLQFLNTEPFFRPYTKEMWHTGVKDSKDWFSYLQNRDTNAYSTYLTWLISGSNLKNVGERTRKVTF